MSWNPQMEFNYGNTTFPYNSAGSFMNFFEGLAYEHVNFIFADELHAQENTYNSMHTSVYKFGFCEPAPVSYYDYGHGHGRSLSDHMPTIDEYSRNAENSVTVTSDQTAEVHSQWEGDTSSANLNANHVDCPRGHHTARDRQVVWQDSIDPDNMSYEELLELGEAVGTQNRGLSQDLISTLPVKKFKCGFFSRKRSRNERCVICQMEYKRGDRQMTLPCKHAYHAGCGTKWLSINKACPICYTEVFADAPKQ